MIEIGAERRAPAWPRKGLTIATRCSRLLVDPFIVQDSLKWSNVPGKTAPGLLSSGNHSKQDETLLLGHPWTSVCVFLDALRIRTCFMSIVTLPRLLVNRGARSR